MVTELNRRRISRMLGRVVCAFSTFILAVVLSTHFNPLGPKVRPGDLENQLFPIVVAKVEIPLGTQIVAEQLTVAKFPHKPRNRKSLTNRLANRSADRLSSVKFPQAISLTKPKTVFR